MGGEGVDDERILAARLRLAVVRLNRRLRAQRSSAPASRRPLLVDLNGHRAAVVEFESSELCHGHGRAGGGGGGGGGGGNDPAVLGRRDALTYLNRLGNLATPECANPCTGYVRKVRRGLAHCRDLDLGLTSAGLPLLPPRGRPPTASVLASSAGCCCIWSPAGRGGSTR